MLLAVLDAVLALLRVKPRGNNRHLYMNVVDNDYLTYHILINLVKQRDNLSKRENETRYERRCDCTDASILVSIFIDRQLSAADAKSAEFALVNQSSIANAEIGARSAG
jgi:hypothetical protein